MVCSGGRRADNMDSSISDTSHRKHMQINKDIMLKLNEKKCTNNGIDKDSLESPTNNINMIKN